MDPRLDERQLAFQLHRKRLFGVAYRMLGSRADAEDMLQEAYLRWCDVDGDEVRNVEAWLVATVTRLSIDRLRRLRTEREAYVGPWLPEPLVSESSRADHAAELASDLSVAFLFLLERLAPEERAAFLLHDVFDSDYGSIARILGKTEPACRQIVSRARKRVRSPRAAAPEQADKHVELLTQLAQAIRNDDQEALLRLFAEESVWTSDGGGKAFAARKAVVGVARIARFVSGAFRHWRHQLSFRTLLVNGEEGLALLHDGKLSSILTIHTDGTHILGVYSLLNPDKLQRLNAKDS